MATPIELREETTSPSTESTPLPPIAVRHTQCPNASKTLRLTENKRRYRARRKEYHTGDLESRLAEAREQGIQATKEVQLAARRVAVENGQLRELLRLVGFADDDIDVWVGRGGLGDGQDGSSCGRRREIAQLARRIGAFAAGDSGEVAEERTPQLSEDVSAREETLSTEQAPESQRSIGEPSELCSSRYSDSGAPATCHSTVTTGEDGPVPEAEARACPGEVLPPCKLLTRLAKDPAADITNVPVPASSELFRDATRPGDIECRKAYEMLISYAVSDEKMDYVAKALEGGCTANGKGGCAVKPKVVLQALDHLCG
ncbi:hypothetical protein QBC47DRAFT_422628 [Echria macrotheca]|uniref:BZIP domain-containing protein n=1 Tax=Echria macrotheca TaxID=438768 RepID=A0AAJ0F7A9_9PEZI|nr:hypothetical protein QBC47DRAFT_422628 [Echria macrotheca]